MAYDPKTGKGMGRFYDAKRRAFRFREWKGFKDTFYAISDGCTCTDLWP